MSLADMLDGWLTSQKDEVMFLSLFVSQAAPALSLIKGL